MVALIRYPNLTHFDPTFKNIGMQCFGDQRFWLSRARYRMRGGGEFLDTYLLHTYIYHIHVLHTYTFDLEGSVIHYGVKQKHIILSLSHQSKIITYHWQLLIISVKWIWLIEKMILWWGFGKNYNMNISSYSIIDNVLITIFLMLLVKIISIIQWD